MEAKKTYPNQLFGQPVRYEIPPFQRPYIWEMEKQWEPLWQDVQDAAESWMDGHRQPHFMGAIVLDPRSSGVAVNEVRTAIVVDGQQRLTTIQILLDAVQEAIEDRQFPANAARLSRFVLNDGFPPKCIKAAIPTGRLKYGLRFMIGKRSGMQCAMTSPRSITRNLLSFKPTSISRFRLGSGWTLSLSKCNSASTPWNKQWLGCWNWP